MRKEGGFNERPEASERPRQTHYDVLGVGRNATSDEIKSAFRRRAKETHPDIPKNREREEEFKRVNEAYEILGDSEKRRRYDLELPPSYAQSHQGTREPSQPVRPPSHEDDFFRNLRGPEGFSKYASNLRGPEYFARMQKKSGVRLRGPEYFARLQQLRTKKENKE